MMEMEFYGIADNIGYEVNEITNLLNGWIPLESGALSLPDMGANMTASVPLTNGVNQLYLRLRATLE